MQHAYEACDFKVFIAGNSAGVTQAGFKVAKEGTLCLNNTCNFFVVMERPISKHCTAIKELNNSLLQDNHILNLLSNMLKQRPACAACLQGAQVF